MVCDQDCGYEYDLDIESEILLDRDNNGHCHVHAHAIYEGSSSVRLGDGCDGLDDSDGEADDCAAGV